jgi:hypothetical protein
VTDIKAGIFGILEILKTKMDWVYGGVEKERNA